MNRYIDADKLQKDGWKLRREKHGLAKGRERGQLLVGLHLWHKDKASE